MWTIVSSLSAQPISSLSVWTLLTVFLLLCAHYLRPIVDFLVDYQRKQRMIRNVAGPPALPLIGCFHSIPINTSHATMVYMEEQMHRILEAGGTFMRVWLGLRLDIWVLDPIAVRVITSSSSILRKGQEYKFFEQWGGTGLLFGTGEKWRRTRKMLTPAFHFGKVEMYAETMDIHARILVAELNKREQNVEFDFYPMITACTMDIIADTAMGCSLNSQKGQNQDYAYAVKRFMEFNFFRFQRPYLTLGGDFLWRLFGYEKETDDILKILKGYSGRIVKERYATFEEQKRLGRETVEKRKLNFLDLMLELNSENLLDMEQLREEVDTFMFAGHDTTTHALSWTMWCLATNPEAQERCYNEIIDIFGHSDAEFHTTRVRELTYVEQCFKESCRVFAPVAIVQRYLEEDVEMDGVVIPRNCTINIPIFLLHRNHKMFPNPHEFNPDNFHPDKQHDPNAFIPFSAGARNCIGQKFALREVMIVLAHLLYNFRFSTHYGMLDNPPFTEGITRPGLGVPVSIQRRR